ncbi:hypothetical protein, partial [Streptosporangium sp. NPDC003464]
MKAGASAYRRRPESAPACVGWGLPTRPVEARGGTRRSGGLGAGQVGELPGGRRPAAAVRRLRKKAREARAAGSAVTPWSWE